MDNKFDSSDNLGYNDDTTNDDTMQIIKMDEHVPLNDTSCEHTTLIANPADTIGDAIYHGCSNHKCGVGFYLRK